MSRSVYFKHKVNFDGEHFKYWGAENVTKGGTLKQRVIELYKGIEEQISWQWSTADSHKRQHVLLNQYQPRLEGIWRIKTKIEETDFTFMTLVLLFPLCIGSTRNFSTLGILFIWQQLNCVIKQFWCLCSNKLSARSSHFIV